MDLDKLETDARAKIYWGESPESVITYLQAQGATAEEAQTITGQMQAERVASIRASSVRKIVIGVGLMLIPAAAYFFFTGAGRIPLKLFGIATAFGVYGAWKLFNGVFGMAFPDKMQGDLSGLDDDDDD